MTKLGKRLIAAAKGARMKCRHDVSQDCPACMQEEIDQLREALFLARARVEYLGLACTDPRHFEANVEIFLPKIDAALSFSPAGRGTP